MRDAPESKERIPWWVFAIIFGLAAVEPVTHLWLRYGLGGGIVHTGFHIGDTPFFLTSMQIFENGFHSPYVICGTGTHDVSFFALPHHWVYGGWCDYYDDDAGSTAIYHHRSASHRSPSIYA